jgi:DNA helicase-2/ATP-dependent DNA helicase PcrA
MRLSYIQVEDYLTCPLKYRFRHVMRVPVLPHHSLVFGRVLHAAVYSYLRQRMKGKRPDEKFLLDAYAENWVNEGYLSREHEEMRKAAGERALRSFYRREEASAGTPAYLEKPFRWQEGGLRFSGRFDRIDLQADGPAIIDYKTSEVASQKEADRASAGSLQLDVYALSFLKTEGMIPVETRLHFLGSDLVGRSAKGEKELRRAEEKIRETAACLRAGDLAARPDWHNCSVCEFKTICPSSYAY